MILRSILGTAVALLLLGAGAPVASAGEASPIRAELDRQRAIWQDLGLASYSYRMQRTCFCPLERVTPGLVVVRDEEIDRVEDEFGYPLPSQHYLTLDELFAVVQEAIDADAESIVVEYDPDRGFPMSIRIDYWLGIADDEIAYTADSFVAGTGYEDLQAELDANRAFFSSLGIDDYDYVMQRGCFCVPESLAPGRVKVRGGKIDEVEDPSSGAPLDPGWYRTLEELFDVIQDAIDIEAYEISVRYDVDYGFPDSISIDRHPLLADDGTSYSAFEFEVPEPAAGALQLAALIVLGAFARRRAQE